MPRPVSDAVMAIAQGIAEGAMLDTVVISGPSTRTRVDLPGGEWTYVEGPGATVTTKGMIGPLSKAAIEQLQAGGVEYRGLEQLDIPRYIVATGADTLQHTSFRHGTTTQYKVEGVTPLDTYAVAQGLIVKAVK